MLIYCYIYYNPFIMGESSIRNTPRIRFGPRFFLLFINDIQDQLQSKMSLFADGSFLYHELFYQNDHTILQKNLDTLAEWLSTWLMHFNIK